MFVREIRPVYIDRGFGKKEYVRFRITFSIYGELYISGDSFILCTEAAKIAKKYSKRDCERLSEIIFRWHNNARKQGTKAQEDFLTEAFVKSGYNWHFAPSAVHKRQILRSADLALDDGQNYGISSTIRHEVPREVIEFLFTLPQCGKKNTWDEVRHRMFEPIPSEDLESILNS